MQLPELLAPAGNRERLETAFLYGADAAYLGMKQLSLRNFADNFSMDELQAACAYAHAHKKRIYVTVNAFLRNAQLPELPSFLRDVEAAGVDALIVNDPGVITNCKNAIPNMKLHLSTQANTLNAASARFWMEQGITRIVLARELTMQEIKEIHQACGNALELEAFVHGAMCVSYSGRCLLSNYINGRDSNKGECAQPCRWHYEFREAGDTNAPFVLEQDGEGSYILNSKDLNLIGRLPDLIDAGITSFKIEGRMKSVYYVACAVNAYRMALDSYQKTVDAAKDYRLDPMIANELNKLSHRPYTEGFSFDPAGEHMQYNAFAGYVQDAQVMALVLSYDSKNARVLLEQRNRFAVGDTLELLTPGRIDQRITVTGMFDEDMQPISAAPHPQQKVWLETSIPMHAGDLLRKEI
ncbi:MAG: U32 family peptidase [Eubacteriales bacterium]|nr:U32 family peptidase [Eubacteriales bacterium]